MVDIYKLHFDNVEIVDKLYKVYESREYIRLLLLNADQLIEDIVKTKERIKQYISLHGVTNSTNISRNNINELNNQNKENERKIEIIGEEKKRD